MAARFAITRVLVVCMLGGGSGLLGGAAGASEDRRAADQSLWHGGTPQQGYGNRRPLQYISSLREANRKKQLVQPESRQNPQLHLNQVPGPAGVQSHLGPSWQQSDVSTNRGQKVPHRPQAAPRSFLLDLKFPLLSSLIPKIDTSKSKVSGLDGGHQSPGPAPDDQGSVEIHSGLGFPSVSADGAKEPNEKPKPSFHLKLVVPIRPSVQPQTAPSGAAKYEAGQQESSGLTLGSHAHPEHSTGEQGGASSSLKPPNKMLQGISTLFGARRPVGPPAGGGQQTANPTDVNLHLGSTLLGAQKPPFGSTAEKPQIPGKPLWTHPTSGGSSPSWGSAGAGHRGTYEAADLKLPSSPAQVGAQESFGGFGGAAPQEVSSGVDANGQQSSTLSAVVPYWDSASGSELESRSSPFGAGRPSWTSAGRVLDRTQTYDPKLQSSSSIAGAHRPWLGSTGSNRQYSYPPPETKPQSGSAGLGPAWGSSGSNQQYSSTPIETKPESGSAGLVPAWGSSGSNQQYSSTPIETKPESGSTGLGPAWGSSGSNQQYSSTPIETKPQSGSVGLGAQGPVWGSAGGNQQYSSTPIETKPQSGSIGLRPAWGSAVGNQQSSSTLIEMKPQSGSAGFGPAWGSAGGNQQYSSTPVETKPQSGSTGLGAQGPVWGSAGGNRQYSSTPIETKPQSGSAGLGPAWGSSGSNQQYSSTPIETKPQSGYAGFGPAWGSAGGHRQYSSTPVETKPQSGSAGFGPAWGSAGGNRQYSSTPIETKPQSGSTGLGAQGPAWGSAGGNWQYSSTPIETKPQSGSAGLGPAWGSAGAAQHPAVPPAEANLLSRRQWPSWSAAGGTTREPTYGPVLTKPHPGSGRRKPSWGETGEQNPPSHKPTWMQAGSSHVESPSVGFTDPYKPVETRPHASSTLFGAPRPSLSSPFRWQKLTPNQADAKLQTGSTQMKTEGPAGGGQQVYQPGGGGLSPSEGLPGQQSSPVDQTKLNPFPNTDGTNVYGAKPHDLTPVSSGSTNSQPSAGYEGPWRGSYGVQEKPSGGDGRPPGLGGSPEHNYHRYDPPVETRPHSPTAPLPPAAPSRNRRPPFIYHGDTAASPSGDTVELVQKYFSNRQSPQSSSIWRPSAQPEFQTGGLSRDSSAARVEGRNRYAQGSAGGGADGWSNYSIHVGSTGGAVSPPETGEGRGVVRPGAPVTSRVDGFAHHFHPSGPPEGNAPGSFQPGIVKVRKHDLLIV